MLDVQQIVAGALEEFEVPLLKYASKILGSQDLARDMVQETFLRLWKADLENIHKYLAPWLYRVCRNLCLDELRKDKKMSSIIDQPDVKDMEDSNYENLSEALNNLPFHHKEVISLKFQSGLSYKEIAKITGHTPSNVGYLIHNGIKQIKNIISKNGKLGGRQ